MGGGAGIRRRLPLGVLAAGLIATLLGAVALALPGPAPSAAADRQAPSRVTIDAWPRGLFGYVKTPAPRCGERRRVTVFKQRGKARNPRRDKRLRTVRAERHRGFFQWSMRTGNSGRFYAKARSRRGCRADLSATIRSKSSGGGGAVGGEDLDPAYPDCGPYTREGTSNVCKIKLGIGLRTYIGCKGFTSTEGNCDVDRATGPFPWGATPDGQPTTGGFDWNWNNHGVVFFAKRTGQSAGAAHLGGTMPGPGFAEFTVTDAFAQNDTGYPNGEHFYTPNLPGQKAGEVGGPLYLDFSSSGGSIKIHGYLYLQPNSTPARGAGR